MAKLNRKTDGLAAGPLFIGCRPRPHKMQEVNDTAMVSMILLNDTAMVSMILLNDTAMVSMILLNDTAMVSMILLND